MKIGFQRRVERLLSNIKNRVSDESRRCSRKVGSDVFLMRMQERVTLRQGAASIPCLPALCILCIPMRKEKKRENPERERSKEIHSPCPKAQRELSRIAYAWAPQPYKDAPKESLSLSLSWLSHQTSPCLILRHLPSLSVLRAFCSVPHLRERERARPRL